MTINAQNLQFEKAPLIYVSFRLQIGLTRKGQNALPEMIEELCENHGFIVPRPPVSHNMFIVEQDDASRKSSNAYCFFRPGEQTQIIIEPTPSKNFFEVKLNKSQYSTFEDFSIDIENLKGVLVALDEQVMINQMDIYYLDASIPAPKSNIQDYINKDKLNVAQAIGSHRRPVITHIERYPEKDGEPESLFQFSAIPLPNKDSGAQVRFFPDELIERKEFGMQLELPVQWLNDNPDARPDSSHFWTLITRATKRYRSEILQDFTQFLSDAERLKNECKRHFVELLDTQKTQEEWGKTTKQAKGTH